MCSEFYIEDLGDGDFELSMECGEMLIEAHQPGMFIINDEPVYIKEVIYQNPATIVLWSDHTKTVAKCEECDPYTRESGLAICIAKKLVGPTEMKKIFSSWCDRKYNRVTLKNVRANNKNKI